MLGAGRGSVAPASERRQGVFSVLLAFGMWGFVPIYYKALGGIGHMEILCHRVVWTVPFIAALIALRRDWKVLKAAINDRKTMWTLVLSALFLGTNWGVFIYAMTAGFVLQSSLGYYINPLINVLLGMFFLQERLRRGQWIAVALVAAGTINLIAQCHLFPWIAFALAFCFSIYGLLRKTVKIEAANGLFVETGLFFPLALGFLLFSGLRGSLAFGYLAWHKTVLLMLAGPVTAVPLVLFTRGARRISYTATGICQYITPTIHFVLAVFLYHEPFTMAHLATFICIWAGLAIFTFDAVKR